MNMETHAKTTETSRKIGVPYHRLYALVRYQIIAPPKRRDSSGHYLWSPCEVEVARQAIRALDARRKRQRARGFLHARISSRTDSGQLTRMKPMTEVYDGR